MANGELCIVVYFALLCLALLGAAAAASGVPATTITSFEGSYHFFAIALLWALIMELREVARNKPGRACSS